MNKERGVENALTEGADGWPGRGRAAARPGRGKAVVAMPGCGRGAAPGRGAPGRGGAGPGPHWGAPGRGGGRKG